MKRRLARINMALAAGGLVLLPACGVSQFLTSRQEGLLTDILDTIIPATDTLGAKALEVPAFVQKVLADCYEQEVQEAFQRGLDTVARLSRAGYGKSFGKMAPDQRLELLTNMAKAEQQDQREFLQLVKELTILGYTNSEYVLTNFSNYTIMPGHYYGCVPVPARNLPTSSTAK
jgi:hypothetical protein